MYEWLNASLKNTETRKSFQLPAIRKLYQNDSQHLMTSLPQEQAAKTNMASMVKFMYSVVS